MPGNLCDPLTDRRERDGGSLPDQKLCQILKWVPAESETDYSGATHFFKQAELISTVAILPKGEDKM